MRCFLLTSLTQGSGCLAKRLAQKSKLLLCVDLALLELPKSSQSFIVRLLIARKIPSSFCFTRINPNFEHFVEVFFEAQPDQIELRLFYQCQSLQETCGFESRLIQMMVFDLEACLDSKCSLGPR